MKTHDPTPRSLAKSLARKQRKHETMLARVEKSSARLERRKLKLHALEDTIAGLERSVAAPWQLNGGATGDALKSVQLIFNPGSGRDQPDNTLRLGRIVSALRAHGIEPRIGLKTSGKAARVLALEAAKAGDALVVVAGGDGTIEDVASQLVGSRTQLGIIPTGTMNNVARSLGVPLDIDDACALIAMGTVRNIDIGRVHANDSTHHEYFLECAGVGLSAISAFAGQAFEKRHWRMIPRALRRFFEAKLSTMRVELDDLTLEAATRVVTVSNAPLMANNMLTAPGAKMDDGYLDVCVYDGMGDGALVAHFLAAAAHKPDATRVYRARKIKITAQERVSSHSDLNIAPDRNVVEITLVPGALRVIVGNGIGLSVPVAAAPATSTYAPAPATTNGTPPGEIHDHAPARG